jgi:hypothetical protein
MIRMWFTEVMSPGGGGGGAAFTVTCVLAVWLPPAPEAVSWYVVVWLGVTVVEPLACTAPTPVMLTELAFVVCHVKVVLWPWVIVAGFALMVAVGGVLPLPVVVVPELPLAPAHAARKLNVAATNTERKIFLDFMAPLRH